MKNVAYGLVVLLLLLCPVSGAKAEVNIGIGIGLPNLSIGINLPMFPTLAPVPGYPVYYAPQVNGNYFFYDSMYWVYQGDNWYASSWYNGPWSFVEPYAVPLYILRIPVRYYRQPPVYFRGWQSNAPPRWGQHWGRDWEQRRSGWDRWNRRTSPARAPLPTYQRRYSGDRYPSQTEQQHTLRSQSYRYQPKDKAVREHLKQQGENRPPAAVQRGRGEAPPVRNQQQQIAPDPRRHQQGAPADLRSQPPQRGGEHVQNPAPAPQHQQQRAPESRDQRQQAPRVQEQRSNDRGEGRDSNRGGRGEGRDKDEDHGRGRDK